VELKAKKPGREDLGRQEFAVLGLLLFLSSGFVFAGLINLVLPIGQGCTLMGCPCENFDIKDETENIERTPIDGERECNQCGGIEFKYHLGLFWVSRTCESTEIIMCEDGERTGKYYEVESCDDYRFGNIFTSEFPHRLWGLL